MLGLMQDQPLLISLLIEVAERHNGDGEIVSRRVEGDIHRTTWGGIASRVRQVANALDGEQLLFSDRIATLAWNGYRHLELYYGVSGSGRVLHTINPRLHPDDQIAWIANHAEDQILCFDLSFLPLVQAVHARCPTIRKWIALCDADKLPADSGIPNLVSYESWMGKPTDYDWPTFDENLASSMCYTSGTTGNPKAALYSHRSTLLHAYAAALPDVMRLSARDSVLPVVPMFHVNAWGIPYSAALVGCKIVFPGPALDGKSVFELIESEGVTFAAGVPTVWQMMLGHMQANGLKFSKLNRTVIGGSACPPAMITAFQEKFNVEVLHAWGMTEMSPLGTLCTLKNKHLSLPPDAQLQIRMKQGRAIFGVDMKIVDGDGKELPWDGKAYGDLLVKGPDRQGILQGRGRRSTDPRRTGPRLVPHGRCRHHRRRGLPADHRPQQGRDQVRRRMDQLDRDREHRRRAPGRRHGRLHRRVPSEVGRAPDHRGREEARCGSHARRAAEVLRRQDRQVADPG